MSIKLNINVSPLANKYYFIKTLAGVNQSYFNSYSEKYIEMTGDLNQEERSELLKFNIWHQGLGESDQKRFMKFCFDKMSLESDLESLPRNCFVILDQRFNKFWKMANFSLIESKKLIQNIYSKDEIIFEKCFGILGNFFDKPLPEKIELSIIYSPTDKMSGRFLDKNKISINVSKKSLEDDIRFKLLLLHESIHACFEDEKYKQSLRDFVKDKAEFLLGKQIGAKNLLREAIATCFASSGILAIEFDPEANERIKSKLIEIKNRSNDLSLDFDYVKIRVSSEMMPVVKEYILKNKKIDENFIQLVWDNILSI